MMLTEETIIKQLNENHTKGFVKQLAAQLLKEHFNLNRLVDLTFHPDQQTGFRAAWLLDTAILANPELYTTTITYLMQRMPQVTNASCKRHYARVMMHLTDAKAPLNVRETIAGADLESLVETCFDWMIDPETKVAVQVCAADTLFNLIPRFNWIKNELENQVKFMMRTGTAAMQARGKKLLAKLEKFQVLLRR
ncbi:hypothetical protein [Mucilaginibacter terrenus]|nr:hypothetical protein [Mucilaginibacter terrenus]